MLSAEEALKKVERAVGDSRLTKTAGSAIARWLVESPFERYRGPLLDDIEHDRWPALDEAFYAVIEFGTGGRRGRMYPVGTNVLNDRTIAESARGLADFVASGKAPGEVSSCAIAYDTRHRSSEFAALCARVLAAAGFRVYLFDGPRSTPLLSFATRHLACDAGIMITASHNPPSDNGFKCYGRSGGQVIPPDDAAIIASVGAVSDKEIPETPLDDAVAAGQVVMVGEEVDSAYIAAVLGESVCHARELSIVYTPLHGVGETSVARALRTAGFTRVEMVPSQSAPDGDFPGVPGHVSNPEIPRTLDAGIALAQEIGADLVIASDPDADRIGVAVPITGDHRGPWTTLDGNQIGALLAAFVIKETGARGLLREDHYLVTTLVTSTMARAIAEREGVRVEDDLLVGFKWIGERIDQAGPAGFLFGFEESHGYLKGTHARDKDAAVAALLFAELAAAVKDRRQSVLEYLDDLSIDVGCHGERLLNKVYEGRAGLAKIQAIMTQLREHPPASIAGLALARVHDFKTHETRDLNGGSAAKPLPSPSGDLLIFETVQPGCRFAARPSGTEPKIKFYLFARIPVANPDALSSSKVASRKLLDQMKAEIDALADQAAGA